VQSVALPGVAFVDVNYNQYENLLNSIAQLVERNIDIFLEITVGQLHHPARSRELYGSPSMLTVTLFTLALLGLVGVVVVILYCANKFLGYTQVKDGDSRGIQMSDIYEENEERLTADGRDVQC